MLAVVTVAAAAVSATMVPAYAAKGPGGTAVDDAAASCWEIKQDNPSAKDGTYWLQTPQLVVPQQFHCDMTTDGGGWVLVGRGKQDWRSEYQGQGSAAAVRKATSGPDAFGVATLSSPTIDKLLGDQRVDSLDDGIRLHRAKNKAGTSWQDATFKLAKRDRWSWAFGAKNPVKSYDFGGAFGSGSGGTTDNFGKNSSYSRIDTRDTKGQGYLRGWSYGALVGGSNDADSYLWSKNGGGSARPFTQVFLRPKLRSSDLDYQAIPDSGTKAQTRSPLLQSGAEPQRWGVTGRATETDNEHYTETHTATQAGSRVFVGGNFKDVRKGKDGEPTAQSYLAAFDVHSGDWESSFRPKFNGQVKSLTTLPNGDLLAGGEFSKVNDKKALGLVALDPKTGKVDPDWSVAIENRLTGGTARVDTMQVSGKWLYLGGSFTHMKGSKQSAPAFTRNAGRVSLDGGTVDPKWNPDFNGVVYDMDIGSGAKRFYAVGHMTWSHQKKADSLAVLSTGSGAEQVPGLKDPKFSNKDNHYQQTVQEAGDRVWVGGSQHSLFSYKRSDFSRLSTNITKPGGDFQASTLVDGVLYAGCHCTQWNYSGSDTWPDPGTDFNQADKLSFVGAWDTKTGQFQPEFNAWMNATKNQGLWGAFEDSTGKVWMLGDFAKARTESGQFEWLGGFARFGPRDTKAPSTPTTLKGTAKGSDKAKLSWHGSTDDRDTPRYEVLRDDRVIAVTTKPSAIVPTGGKNRFAVRAVDTTDNRSASTPVDEVDG